MIANSIRLTVAALASATVPVCAQLVATPYSKTGIYRVNQTVGWTIAIAPEQQGAPGLYSYTITENGQRTIKSGTLAGVSDGSNASAR